MLDIEQLSMPFVRKDIISQPEMEIQRAIRSQNNLYNIFISKSNARRISHYFIIHKSTQTINVINCIEFLFLLILITAFLVLLRVFFVSDVKKMQNYIYESIFEQVETSVQNILHIPTMFSMYLSNFIKNGHIPHPSNDSAYLYASLLTNAHLSSTGHMNRWKIGLPNGGLIAIVTNSTYSSKWCYVSYDEKDYGSFYEWDTNSEGRNESYPFAGGIRTGYYNTISQHWYKIAVSSNVTQWTNLYYEIFPEQLNIQPEATFSVVSSVQRQNELICAISIDLKIRYIHDFLESIQVPSNSILAITTSDDYLIAATSSSGIPLHLDENRVTSSTIQDIDDPVWNCVSRPLEFRTTSNFTIRCLIDNSYQNYHLFRSILPFSDRYNWTLIAVIRIDSANESGKVMYNGQYITPTIVCIAIIIVLFCLSRLILSFIFSEQTKLLLSQKQHINRHVIDSGICQGLSQLQRATNVRSSGRFRNPQDLLEKSTKKLLDSPQKLYFDYIDFFSRIKDNELLEKIKDVYKINNELIKVQQIEQPNHETARISRDSSVDLFGGPKGSYLTDTDDSNPNSSDTNVDKSTKTSSNTSSNNSNNSYSNRESEVDIWNQESRAKYMHNAKYIDEPLADLPSIDINHVSHHQNMRNLNIPSSINIIKNIGVGYNVQHQKLFDVNKFKEFLQNFITSEIPPENLFLVVDSFDLYNIFIFFFGSFMFCDQDMIIAGYITLLAFHVATKKRLNQTEILIDRFFIRHKNDIYKEADSILVKIAKLKKSEVHFNNNRWSNIVSYVHCLCEITPFNRHIEIFQRCKFFIKPSMIFRKLSYDRSIELLNFFYLTTTVSFLVNTNSFVDSAITKLVSDRRTNKKFSDQFYPCLNSIYLSRLMKSLVSICGNTFVKKLTLPI